MRKKLLFGVFFIIIFIIMLIMPNKSSAATNGYEIQSYDINMIVNENNTFDITEKITVYFNKSKYRIIRKIPLRNSIETTDGTKSNNTAKITDISVNEKYSISDENGYKVIKIGSNYKTFVGVCVYTIKYKYDIGKDPLKNADELYFNLIGNEWDTSIDKVTFNIQMPKSFNESNLEFSSGDLGSTDNSNIEYSVDGNVITGNTINKLNAGQVLTVRLTLPEKYFNRVFNNVDSFFYIVLTICIIFVLISFLVWLKNGKDEQVVETVEFYPPEGYNSAEVSFLYNGSIDIKGVMSLLIYLADKGYLKIEESKENEDSSNNYSGFRITKLKEYDGNNEYEKMFFEGLFNVNSNKSQTTNETPKNSVTESDLCNKFYFVLNEIKEKMNSKENKDKIYENVSNNKSMFVIVMIIIIFSLITIKPIIECFYSIGMAFIVLIFSRNRILYDVKSYVWTIKEYKTSWNVTWIIFNLHVWFITVFVF